MKNYLKIVVQPGRAGNIPKIVEFKLDEIDQPVTLEIKPWVHPKTDQQRKYFHGVVLATIAKEKGIEFWKVKEAIRQAFLKPVPNPFQGGEYFYQSTETLTREEYSDLIEQTLAWAAENGIYIPGPEELR